MQNFMILPTRNDTDRTGHWRDNQAIRYESNRRTDKSPINPNLQVKGLGGAIQTPKTRLTATYADHFYNEANVDKYINFLDKGGRTAPKTPQGSMSTRSDARLQTISRMDREGVRAGVHTTPKSYNPIVSCTEVSAPRAAYQNGVTQNDFTRPGWQAYQSRPKTPEPEIKIGHPGAYNPGPKFNTRNFKHKNLPPGELVTLNAHGIDDKMKCAELRRELAGQGHLLIEGKFKYNLINNQSTGDGVVHVRAGDKKELDTIKRKIEAKGLVVDVAKSYKPLWKN